MAYLHWNPTFSVGVEQFDRHHQALVDMVNQLHDAMRAGKGQQELSAILDRLANYTLTHFASEEKLMTQYHFPGLASHKAAHDELARQVTLIQEKYKTSSLGLSIQVMNFLKDWLTNHILGEDMGYKDFFNQHNIH